MNCFLTHLSGDNWAFVGADKTLCNVVQLMGLKAINPSLHIPKSF